MKVGTNYWDVGWGSGAADPFKDGYGNVSGTDPWRPELLAETAFYTAHRFMDWNKTNGSEEVHWTDRTQQGDANQRPVAYEWMIDFCNRQKADAWITVPHRTYEDQGYWTQLAELVLSKLDPTLKLYIEYSNETWNFIFSQATYCRNQGVALNLDSEQYRAGFEFHVYAAVRLFEKFNAVWGADNPRLIKVLAGQSVNTWITGVHLAALADPVINPNGVKATAYSIAPYFGNGTSTIEGAAAAIPGTIERVANQAAALANSGLRFLAYEGGQHVVTNAEIVSRNPQIYQHYLTYLRGIESHLELFMHYNHASSFSSSGAWGAKEGIGQDIAQAHKLRALWDYAADGGPDPDEETLVPFKALWKYNTELPLPVSWTQVDFDDSAWEVQVEQEEDAVYMRKKFASIANAKTLRLTVKHDKGFIAYLNGVEVLRVEAGTANRVYQIDQYANLLLPGNNVLAIKLFIEHLDSDDLSFNPELTATF